MTVAPAGLPVAPAWVHESVVQSPLEATAPDRLMAQCLDALPELIEMTDARGQAVFFNRAAFQYFGPGIVWPKEQDRLCHPDDHEARREARDKVLRRGVRARVAWRAVRFDYTPRWHLCDLTPLFDQRALVTGMLIRMTDFQDQPRDLFDAAPTRGFG